MHPLNNQLPCVTEPIHIPNKIQAHGFLISFEITTGKINHVSENINDLTGFKASDLLGENFTKTFKGSLSFDVEEAIKVRKLKNHRNVEISTFISVNGNEYLVIGHQFEETITLEFEPKDKYTGFEDPFSWLDNAQKKIKNKKTIQSLLNETLSELKELTHFERLMVYKFNEDGSGKVIAEVKDEKLEPFLGLHFPAIDIPPRARDLLFRNWVRHITNTKDESIQLLNASNTSLDMSYTNLRSVSECHTEYLNNMGVQASLSIALIHAGKLWGLLNCHHTSPKFVGFHRRNTCQLFGRFLSLLIPTKEREDIDAYFREQESLVNKVILNIHSSKDFYSSFKREIPKILEQIDACGITLSLHNEITKVGRVPSSRIIKELITNTKWSPENLSYKQEDHLKEIYKGQNLDDLNGCCGFLSFRIPEMGNGCLILFREEYTRTISWGGNPNPDIDNFSKGQPLTPRASFELFLEEVHGKAKKWEKQDIHFLEHFIAKLKDEIILFQGGELQKTTSILKTIYEDSMDALFLVDLHTDKIIDCNDQAVTFLDTQSKDDLIGKTGWDFHLLDIPKDIRNNTKTKIKAGESIIKEVEYKVDNEKIKWGHLHAKLIKDSNQDVYLVRVVDITEKKNIEENIFLKNEELLKLNKELDRFVYSSSHDLRAPISSLTGLFEIIEQIDDKDEMLNLLQHGKKSLKRLDKFIHDILNYSRNTRLEVKSERMNLNELIEGILADYKYMFTENPVVAKMDIDINHELTTDAYRIKVILNNIISNAFKYRNPYITDSYVHVIANELSNGHQIIIKDNGLGIGQDHLANVFDMFYRADDKQAGSGLGLYIVKEMIEKLNGSISLNSEVNKGSTFMIELPKFR